MGSETEPSSEAGPESGAIEGANETAIEGAKGAVDGALDRTAGGTGENAGAGSWFQRSWAGLFGKPDSSSSFDASLDDQQREAVGRLEAGRREMIERVIAFDEKRVVDVMAPRADIVGVEIKTPLDELARHFADAGHSRMPVYRGDLDDPVGMAHIKDVLALMADKKAVSAVVGPVLKAIRRDVLYVPPSMRITDLLLRMQASRIHMALVIDEFGGTDGLVTIEDLVEEIVGDINDEHDEDDAPMVIARPGEGWDADARVDLKEFLAATGVELALADEEIDTLGGVVFSLAGRVPQRGELIAHPSGLEFEVTEADARKIRKVRIRRIDLSSAAAE